MQKKRWLLFKNKQKTQRKNEQPVTKSEKRFLKKKEKEILSKKALIAQKPSELQKQNEQDRGIIRNQDTSPSEREAAEGRVEERQEELARLRTQIEGERKSASTSREDQRDLQKIWRDGGGNLCCCWRHDWCCHWRHYQRFESHWEGAGERFERSWQKKTASVLPGLLGSIVSFLFKAAGKAIGFLAEH